MNPWSACKNILIVRGDNMGDLILSAPAIRALKQTFGCSVTVLTSESAAHVVSLIPDIDDVIKADLPWVKKDASISPARLLELMSDIRSMQFDGAVIFTVYSQSALPAALFVWECGIPLRLAYCRENPYELLTHWIPDKEPYDFIRHQVIRDKILVESVGAQSPEDHIHLQCPEYAGQAMNNILLTRGIRVMKPYFVFHPGVTEEKRRFPEECWAELIVETKKRIGVAVYISGSSKDAALVSRIIKMSGNNAVSLAGMFSVSEFAAFIKNAALLVSVNTGPVHLASGFQIPVVVLYAQTNPQHTPWKTMHRILEYSIPQNQKSRNEVIRYVDRTIYNHERPIPDSNDIIGAMKSLIQSFMPETPIMNQYIQ